MAANVTLNQFICPYIRKHIKIFFKLINQINSLVEKCFDILVHNHLF